MEIRRCCKCKIDVNPSNWVRVPPGWFYCGACYWSMPARDRL